MERIFLAATTVPTSSMPSAESRFGSLSGAVNDADRITLKTGRHSPSNSSSSSSSDELDSCKFDRYRRRTPEAMLDESLHSQKHERHETARSRPISESSTYPSAFLGMYLNFHSTLLWISFRSLIHTYSINSFILRPTRIIF